MEVGFLEMDFDACGHCLASSYTSEAPRMRSVKLTMLAAASRVALIAALGFGCAAPARPGGAAGAAGGAGSTAAAGTGGTTGASGAGALGTAGAATGSGEAGAGDPSGAAGDPGSTPGTVPSGAGGTVDQGLLFTDAAAVSLSSDAGAASTPEAAADTGGKSAPGDGNTSTCHVGGMSFVLVFTQKGTDVTMVVTASNCPAGNHTIQIHGGFSCDNAGTEGGVWDGKRGDGIPMLACANNKGSLTYTRSAADPTTSWTVGDHATKTDVTLHPMSVDTSCGTFF
jgi:hypothetical protein